jgi:hypothetical protein
VSIRVVILPPVPALLPCYRGRIDPVADLRSACRKAITWLVDDGVSPVSALADAPDRAARLRGVEVPLGMRVARTLLDEVGYTRELRHADAPAHHDRRLLVLANGSGRRSDKAPGHLDPRSFAYDQRIETALAEGDSAGLARLDAELGRDLLAAGIEPLRQLGEMRLKVQAAALLYADDPYGVRYWVATWRGRNED